VLGADRAHGDTLSAAPTTLQDNFLPCSLIEMLPLGEISVCKLRVHSAPEGDHVSLNLSTALLRGLRASVGTELLLHLPPQALHIMPLR
jgi:molybdate transport system ATP-binding protein